MEIEKTYHSLVLTRYLYNKEKVLEKLEECVLSGKEDEAYFWAYELYFSFLEDELFERIFSILKIHYPNYPKLYKYLFKKYGEWKIELDKKMNKNIERSEILEDNLNMIIAVFIQNIIIRKRENPEPKTQLYIIIPLDSVFLNNYKTNLIQPVRKTLQMNCKYSLVSNEEKGKNPEIKNIQILREITDHWLYYASRCPLWRERICRLGGSIIDEEKMIIFENDDLLEGFYDKYGFEMDEQILLIQRGCIGI